MAIEIVDALCKALESVKSYADFIPFGQALDRPGEAGGVIHEIKKTKSGILIDFSHRDEQLSPGLIGCSYLKLIDVEDFKWIMNQTITVQARVVEILKYHVYSENYSNEQMFVGFWHMEKLHDDVIQDVSFLSHEAKFSRIERKTEAPALTLCYTPTRD